MYRCCPSVRPSVLCLHLEGKRKGLRIPNLVLGHEHPVDNFKVKGSKVKVTGHGSCVNVSLIIRPSNVGYSTSASRTLLCHRERFTGSK